MCCKVTVSSGCIYTVKCTADDQAVISVVQAQAQSPKPAKPSPSHQSCHQGFTGPRAWALIFGSLRLWLQALSVYADKFSVIFSVKGFKNFFNCAILLISANISEYFTKKL